MINGANSSTHYPSQNELPECKKRRCEEVVEPDTYGSSIINNAEGKKDGIGTSDFLDLDKKSATKKEPVLTRSSASANSSSNCHVSGESMPVSTASFAAFKDFKLFKVLREDARMKFVTLHGSIGDSDAVVLLERKAFHVPTLETLLRQTSCLDILKNDIYSTYDLFTSSQISDTKATLICPATEKHIIKYADREPFVVQETQELYQSVVLPCIEQSKFSLEWVYNILDKKTESERIVFEDPDLQEGFILLPDMKWDGTNPETLYLIAIVHRRDLRSIRDLTQQHLPLLQNLLHKCKEAIHEKFRVGSDKLRIYFHYQPSYYHLHVHFTHIKFEAPGTDVLRAHLLDDVIDNIQLQTDFYRHKTLSYLVREHDALYTAFKEKNFFQSKV